MNKSCDLSTTKVRARDCYVVWSRGTHESVMTHINESQHTWMSHDTCEMSHVTYERVEHQVWILWNIDYECAYDYGGSTANTVEDRLWILWNVDRIWMCVRSTVDVCSYSCARSTVLSVECRSSVNVCVYYCGRLTVNSVEYRSTVNSVYDRLRIYVVMLQCVAVWCSVLQLVAVFCVWSSEDICSHVAVCCCSHFYGRSTVDSVEYRSNVHVCTIDCGCV